MVQKSAGTRNVTSADLKSEDPKVVPANAKTIKRDVPSDQECLTMLEEAENGGGSFDLGY